MSQPSHNPKAGNVPEHVILPTKQLHATEDITDPSRLLMGSTVHATTSSGGKQSYVELRMLGGLLGSLTGEGMPTHPANSNAQFGVQPKHNDKYSSSLRATHK